MNRFFTFLFCIISTFFMQSKLCLDIFSNSFFMTVTEGDKNCVEFKDVSILLADGANL